MTKALSTKMDPEDNIGKLGKPSISSRVSLSYDTDAATIVDGQDAAP